MKFVNTDRFSPVTELGDLPWEYDLFHHTVYSLPETKKDLDSFISKNNIIPDASWWLIQRERSINGYTIPFAIEKGGDVFLDGWDCIWNDSAKKMNYGPGIDIPPESVYMPEYNLFIEKENLWIPGRFYFYLNFWIIFGLKRGEKIKKNVIPRFLDIDFGFYQRVNLMIERGRGNLQETKTRQKGFSEKMAELLGWNMTHWASSLNIVAGGMSDDAEKTFANTVRGLDNLRNTQFYRQRSVNRASDFHIKNKNGGAELLAISCKDNAQAISRHSPTFIIYEEGGKWKKGLLKKAKEYVKVSLEAEGIQTGFSITLGTGGDMDLGAADLQDMHYNPENHDLLKFRNKWEIDNADGYTANFTPGWQYKIIDANGNSLKELSLIYLKEEEAKKNTAEDLYVFRTQNAIYAADAFALSGGLFFGPTIANWANARKAYLLTHKSSQIVKRYMLHWKNGLKNWKEGVEFEETMHGPFYIAELPRTYRDASGQEKVYKNLYKQATDSYDQNEAKTSTSKGSSWIKKGFLNANESYNKVVAGILIRPEVYEGGRETFYEYTALLSVAYDTMNIIEHRNLLIFEWLFKHGLGGFVKERPGIVHAYTKNSLTTNTYGIDPAFKPHALKILKDHYNNRINIENIDFIQILEAIVKYKLHKDYNCDITISLAYLETLMEDEAHIIASEASQEILMAPMFKRVNGQLIKCYND